jgi:hypothetical protein
MGDFNDNPSDSSVKKILMAKQDKKEIKIKEILCLNIRFLFG